MKTVECVGAETMSHRAPSHVARLFGLAAAPHKNQDT